jgi:hypothetical protein
LRVSPFQNQPAEIVVSQTATVGRRLPRQSQTSWLINGKPQRPEYFVLTVSGHEQSWAAVAGANPMSIQSISFWQQDQTYWQQQQAEAQASTADNALISTMGDAMANLSKGLSSIANQTALNRVKTELSAAVQNELQSSGSSTSSSSGQSTAPSSSSSASGASGSSNSSSTSTSPATGTGTAPLTTSTALSVLGIPANGTITVSDGTNTTTYTSTGTDTIADLIDAINVDIPGNANVTASLNNRGELVITSRNSTDTITVGGVYASNVGFDVENDTFQPTKVASSSSSSADSSTGSAPSGTSSASSSSTGAGTKASKSTTTNSSLALQSLSTAASILSADGVSGSLVDMLA